MADHRSQFTDCSVSDRLSCVGVPVVPIEVTGNCQNRAVLSTRFNHSIRFSKARTHRLGGKDRFDAQFCQAYGYLCPFRGSGRHGNNIRLLFFDHLPIVSVKGLDPPTPLEIIELWLINIRSGNQIHVPCLKHSRCMGKRPRVVWVTDYFIVDGAAHPATPNNGAAVGTFGFTFVDNSKCFTYRLSHEILLSLI